MSDPHWLQILCLIGGPDAHRNGGGAKWHTAETHEYITFYRRTTRKLSLRFRIAWRLVSLAMWIYSADYRQDHDTRLTS